MADARVERTLVSIKGAMLALLEEKRLSEIGMAELARAAGVSRATLYSHYPHTREVFTELVGDFCKHVRSLPAQLRHSECAQACRRPFCMTIRAAGPFQPLVLAPEFMGAYLDYVLNGPEADEALAPYLAAGVTRSQAQALFTFQMTGCYNAAILNADVKWAASQQAIDQFIRGGLQALRSMPPSGGSPQAGA